jgi:hypothetical protein
MEMKPKKSKSTPRPSDKQKVSASPGASEFAFGKENYKLLLIGLVLILVGFLLMIGGGSDDPNVFSEKIFNFRRLTLAPILVLAGYVVEIFAIMKKPKD